MKKISDFSNQALKGSQLTEVNGGASTGPGCEEFSVSFGPRDCEGNLTTITRYRRWDSDTTTTNFWGTTSTSYCNETTSTIECCN